MAIHGVNKQANERMAEMLEIIASMYELAAVRAKKSDVASVAKWVAKAMIFAEEVAKGILAGDEQKGCN